MTNVPLFFSPFSSSHSGPQSKLCDASPNEDFTLSLGADQSIRVTCNPVIVTRGYTRGLLKNNLDVYVHTIDIRNTKENPIILELQEQVPLSTSEKIKVGVACCKLQKLTHSAPSCYGHTHTHTHTHCVHITSHVYILSHAVCGGWGGWGCYVMRHRTLLVCTYPFHD